MASLALALVSLALPSAAGAQSFDPQRNNYLQALPITGLEGPGIRQLDVTHDNNGATIQSSRNEAGQLDDLFEPVASGSTVAEPDNCFLAGTVWYDSTVWYQLRAPWNGRLNVRVSATAFRPVASVMPYNTSGNQLYLRDLGGGSFAIRGSNCEVAGEVSRALNFDYSGGTDASFGGPYVRAGVSYKVQVGSAQAVQGTNNGQGSYRLILTYDPDRDGDSLFESQEDPRCVGVRGAVEDRGCPDSDDDDIVNLDDQCDAVRGRVQYDGCPDGDGDGIPEKAAGLPGRDVCPGENSAARDAARNGCLDFRQMNAQLRRSYSVRFSRSGKRIGVTLTKLFVRKVPRGARVSLTCKKGKRRVCRFRAKTAGASGKVTFISKRRAKSHKSLPPNTTIAAKVTNPGRLYIGSYLALKTTRRDVVDLRERCIAPRGSSKPKRCSQVSVAR